MNDRYRNDRVGGEAHGGGSAERARWVVDNAFVRRLGDAGYDEEAGRVGFLDMMAASGVSIPEGVVLTPEFHRRFLETGGLAAAIRDSAQEDIRRRAHTLRREYGRAPIGDRLNRMICEAIIGLGARKVVVISEDVTQSGLTTLPAARDAVRKAWLSVNGLMRQIGAASRGEKIPTWSVLIQREARQEVSLENGPPCSRR